MDVEEANGKKANYIEKNKTILTHKKAVFTTKNYRV